MNWLCLHAGIFLMGYGLVAVPRQLWRTADIKGQEKASFHKAGLQADRAITAKKCVTATCSFALGAYGTNMWHAT